MSFGVPLQQSGAFGGPYGQQHFGHSSVLPPQAPFQGSQYSGYQSGYPQQSTQVYGPALLPSPFVPGLNQYIRRVPSVYDYTNPSLNEKKDKKDKTKDKNDKKDKKSKKDSKSKKDKKSAKSDKSSKRKASKGTKSKKKK